MKKMYFFVMLAISLLAFTQQSVAQEGLTSKTATKEKGYTVLNSGEVIVIYKHSAGAYAPKQADKNVATYFFTTASSNVLQPLTKANLKEAVPTNHPFHDALDATFKDDKELTLYDDFHKMYKISHLLMMNTKQ